MHVMSAIMLMMTAFDRYVRIKSRLTLGKKDID
jgi:hypothetical protein